MSDKIHAALRDLEQLSEQGLPETERKIRLAELKERFRIENVYELAKQTGSESADSADNAELAAIRSHLEPLALAPEGTPLPELARLAALKITEK
jgi:hypothetical protein